VAIATRTRVIDVPAGQNVFQRGTSTENRQPVLFAFLFAFLFLFLFLCFSFLFFFFLCDRDAFSLIQKTHLIVCQDRLGTNTSQNPCFLKQKRSRVLYNPHTGDHGDEAYAVLRGGCIALDPPPSVHGRARSATWHHHQVRTRQAVFAKAVFASKTIKQFTKTGSGRRRQEKLRRKRLFR
jgi:hypothetical protein